MKQYKKKKENEKMEFNKSKFSFKEITMNSDGKQSGSGFIGVILGLITAAAFITGMAGWWVGKEGVIEILEIVLQLGLLAALLLGARKVTSGFGKDKS